MKFKIKSKKAQVFTLIAISLIGLLFLTFSIYSYIDKRHPVEVRVSSIESFLGSIEQNLERQMYISGFRIIFLAQNQIILTGNYIPDTDDFFNEAFYNGTVNDINDSILIGATYDFLIDSINDKAKKINVDVTLSNSVITVDQVDPWHVRFSIVSDFLMEDKSGLAKWEKRQNISALIPINSFEDPIYTVNTNAKISKKFNQTIFEGNYVSGSDVSNLLSHIQNEYYSNNSNAPSFLKRLEGDLSADENGIESFVNTNRLAQEGLPVSDKTKIDYIYFNNGLNPVDYHVTGMPAWFTIDDQNGHLEKYQVSGLTF